MLQIMQPTCLHPTFSFHKHQLTKHIVSLSLHDALPISGTRTGAPGTSQHPASTRSADMRSIKRITTTGCLGLSREGRSEEHTSELQSRGQLVCRLLLEKKKKRK